MNHAAVNAALRQALDALLRDDERLLAIDVNERSLTHRLALHMMPLFDRWHVDCEYNRDHNCDPKKLTLPESIGSDDLKQTTAYPDIIVHRRMQPGREANLLVVEAKKRNNGDFARDLAKLKAFMRAPFEYQHALLLIFEETGEPEFSWQCLCGRPRST